MQVRELGLAAYIKYSGAKLVKVEGKLFIFDDTEKTLRDWEIEYSNSCCMGHDQCVMQLRKLMTDGITSTNSK